MVDESDDPEKSQKAEKLLARAKKTAARLGLEIECCSHLYVDVHEYDMIVDDSIEHAYIHAHEHAYIHTEEHAYIHPHEHAYIHTHEHAYIHTHEHAYIHIHEHAYIHIHD